MRCNQTNLLIYLSKDGINFDSSNYARYVKAINNREAQQRIIMIQNYYRIVA